LTYGKPEITEYFNSTHLAMKSEMKSIIFWDVTPCSLPPAYLLVLAEIIYSTLKMEAICSSETSVATQQTTRRHISEDDTLHNHRCENLKSYEIRDVKMLYLLLITGDTG
jgi:hypothetical protein